MEIMAGAVGDDETEKKVDYWRNKCTSLQKQVDNLVVANMSLGKQLEEKVGEVRKLRKVLQDNDDKSRISRQNSFSVFPEEVWEIILEFVADPQDLLNVRMASNQLNTLLHPSKATWMLKPIIVHIFQWLAREDILKCRLVCKKWNAAIDELLENHPSKRPFVPKVVQHYQNDSHLKEIKLNNSVIFHLWDVDKLRTLRAEMHKHSKNPFIGRSVVFNVEIDDDFEDEDDFDDPGIGEFWELTKMFLTVTGQHIWYVEITEDSGHQKPLEFYKLLRELLFYLSHLRSLKLAVDISHDDFYPKSLSLYMGSNPLPVMPNLESLDVECFYPEVPQIIHDMLIAMYSAQLTKLCVNMNRWKNSYSRGLNKLTELHVKRVSLGKLAFLEAPSLGKVSVDLRESSTAPHPISARCLFETLSRFPLRLLILHVDITVELEEIGTATQQLCSIPTLEKLEIHGIQRKISYSFLLCFPFIKYLNIRESTSGNKFNEDPAVVAFLGDAQPQREIMEIHKYMYTGRMYESSIWRRIPTLRTFTYENFRYGELVFRHNCNRETYEYRYRTKTL